MTVPDSPAKTESACRTGEFSRADYLYTLLGVKGLGNQTVRQLLAKTGGCPETLWQESPAWVQANLPPQTARAFEQSRAKGVQRIPDLYAEKGIRVLTESDPQYPPLLKEIHDAPLLLYVQGNPAALTGKTLAVVGTRRMTDYGDRATQTIIEELKPAGVCIVSGLAAGIDGSAHWAALRNGLQTVAVFGTGLDHVFPVGHRGLAREILASGGALVSEYPLGTPGSPYTFPERNRIVVGLSHGTIVVEAPRKSGALITARLANEEGRSVFAVPGNVFSPNSEGPMHLLRSGAIPVSGGRDILRDLQWWQGETAEDGPQAGLFEFSAPKLPDLDGLSEGEQKLLVLLSFDPVSVETVQQRSGLPSAQVNELITLLELNGLVKTLPGAKVCRTA